jgi:serine/threonine-protein phosphatase 6 regulatory subunit 3
MRLGYMGHLTFIADEVIKLFEGYPEAIVQDIKGVVDLDLWYQYCENELRETKERDCLPLGGDRPIEDDAAMREEEEDEEELDVGTAPATQVNERNNGYKKEGGIVICNVFVVCIVFSVPGPT